LAYGRSGIIDILRMLFAFLLLLILLFALPHRVKDGKQAGHTKAFNTPLGGPKDVYRER
jgi:hypothetical protein